MNRDNMNWEEVQHLIDRFYEGTTTHEEEELLMALPQCKDVPEHLRTDVEVFRALAQERQTIEAEPELPEGFEQRLMASIAENERRESLSIAPKNKAAKPKTPMLRWWMSAAACLLVVLGTSLWLPNFHTDEETMFAASDITQEEAEAYTLYALTMVSNCMQQSVEEMECIGRVQEQVRQTLHETITP